MRLEDMDAATLERRALIMGDLVDSFYGWARAANSAIFWLTGITVGWAIGDLVLGRSPWPLLVTYLVCYAFFFGLAELLLLMSKRALVLMKCCVDRRQELVELARRPPKPPASSDGTGGG